MGLLGFAQEPQSKKKKDPESKLASNAKGTRNHSKSKHKHPIKPYEIPSNSHQTPQKTFTPLQKPKQQQNNIKNYIIYNKKTKNGMMKVLETKKQNTNHSMTSLRKNKSQSQGTAMDSTIDSGELPPMPGVQTSCLGFVIQLLGDVDVFFFFFFFFFFFGF